MKQLLTLVLLASGCGTAGFDVTTVEPAVEAATCQPNAYVYTEHGCELGTFRVQAEEPGWYIDRSSGETYSCITHGPLHLTFVDPAKLNAYWYERRDMLTPCGGGAPVCTLQLAGVSELRLQ